MPPLLAALLMIELGCTLDTIMAIDWSMEWRDYGLVEPHTAWYAGQVGLVGSTDLRRGSYWWPNNTERLFK